ncbi:MAG: PolC-type DNA polymerase III [Breznakia sp.]
MKQEVYELAKKIGIEEMYLHHFKDAIFLKKPTFETREKTLVLEIEFDCILTFQVYDIFRSKLMLFLRSKVTIFPHYRTKEYSLTLLQHYIRECAQTHPKLKIFANVYPRLDHECLIFAFSKIEEMEQAQALINILYEALLTYGLDIKIATEHLEIEEDIKPLVQKERPLTYTSTQPGMSASFEKKKTLGYTPRKKIKDFHKIAIKDIQDGISEIKFVGRIFDIVMRDLWKGKKKQSLYIADDEGAIVVARIEGQGRVTREMLESVQVGDDVEVYGRATYDMYERDVVVAPNVVEKIHVKRKEDNEKVKRVELHVHTKLSEMDAVSSIEEYILQANAWGHDAISINDHNVVQAYPAAQKIVKQINQTRKVPFKLLYGIEMGMVEDALNIVYNADDRELRSARICVFDLETTGLSSKRDHIIEFGAKIINQGRIEDSFQTFVKSPVSISSKITQLTGITNQHVEQAPTLKALVAKLRDFIGDSILVAHNAAFDINFLNDAFVEMGEEPFINPVIDTWHLAIAILPKRRAYNLGAIARHYKIKYDSDGAHRADYDANVLADVFLSMLRERPEIVCLQDLLKLNEQIQLGSVREKHVNILAKNQAGIKDIFELVTLSHTSYLAEMQKSNNKPICAPKIPRSILQKYHDRGNLLFGSSCLHGEVFELAQTRGDHLVKKAMEFYDFIELQPPANYSQLVDTQRIKDNDELLLILKMIYECGKAMEKLVVASGDAHYVSEDHKQIRDVFINANGIGGVRHPLYLYREQERRSIASPAQHFRTTKEMLDAFAFFSEEKRREIVVENTNKIAAMIDVVEPIKADLYPPHIDDCANKLTSLCYDSAHALYGNPLPNIVKERLEKELTSIIGNGFEVVYYVSHLLVKQSMDDGYLVGSRGSVGSSFVATMANVTEVNPLAPHYVCPKCQHSEFLTDGSVQSGFDLKAKRCPKCGENMRGDGQFIPFETFLGFEGDKVPDIDLNFSGEYQEKAHKYIQNVFGDKYAFRAGTIASVAQKTAFGYVKGYQEEMGIEGKISNARIAYLAKKCDGVRRSTGQHPGGIIVFPQNMDVSDFTPIQFPSNNPNEEMKTTHLDYHDIEQNVLKFDILGHVDPTAMKILSEMSGVNVLEIPMNDEATMAIFSSVDTLNMDTTKNAEKTGAAGIPEFGTKFVRGILETTKPTTFDELLKISGLSHGTDVWLNNAKDLIDNQTCTLKEVIGCRDDIMVHLMQKGMDSKLAFTIMESVRKGRGLNDEWRLAMKENNVEDYYISSCEKIKYMFPKAHAVAYVTMAVRIAWFKVHRPLVYYCMFFSIRCDAYDVAAMIKGEASIRERLSDIRNRYANPETKRDVSDKELNIESSLELALEMVLRGYRFMNLDINKSQATQFSIAEGQNAIYPSFVSVDGLGENVAYSIVEARKKHPFISKQDLQKRTLLSTTLIKKLDALGVLTSLQEENQMRLF